MARQDLQPSLKDLPSTRLELATQRAEGELATTVLITPHLLARSFVWLLVGFLIVCMFVGSFVYIYAIVNDRSWSK